MHPILYLSTFFAGQQKEFYIRSLKSTANVSASAFSYSLLSGLAANKKPFFCINTPLTGPYPIDSKRIWNPTFISEEFGCNVVSIGSCNLYGIQGSALYRKIYKAMSDLNIGATDILVYSIQLPLLKAAIRYKNCNRGSRIILVVPDLYDDINSHSFWKQTVKSFLFGDFVELCNEVDGYVLLTEQMLERMPVVRPFCVVEGIYNPLEHRVTEKQQSDIFTVFYSGMLYEKFGVKNLIDAVSSLNTKNIRLRLCGSGELEDYIRTKAKNDSRIEYLGMLARDKVLQLQCEASLLVNPRQPNGGFTKYSFPSKNIEYLASGVPTLIYELEGIPEEYYQYCYHLSASQKSVSELSSMIEDIYMKTIRERSEIADRARSFIINKKNAPAQCAKILNFINTI